MIAQVSNLLPIMDTDSVQFCGEIQRIIDRLRYLVLLIIIRMNEKCFLTHTSICPKSLSVDGSFCPA